MFELNLPGVNRGGTRGQQHRKIALPGLTIHAATTHPLTVIEPATKTSNFNRSEWTVSLQHPDSKKPWILSSPTEPSFDQTV